MHLIEMKSFSPQKLINSKENEWYTYVIINNAVGFISLLSVKGAINYGCKTNCYISKASKLGFTWLRI